MSEHVNIRSLLLAGQERCYCNYINRLGIADEKRGIRGPDGRWAGTKRRHKDRIDGFEAGYAAAVEVITREMTELAKCGKPSL